jgi:ABC-type phosphate transport system ATPase subunit
MYMGELVELGKTKDVFENPKEARTAAYIEGCFG